MSQPQLALPAPYGYRKGYHISLRAQEGFDAENAQAVIMEYGCPRSVADKAISCLKASERYDCVMMPRVFSDNHAALVRKLQASGVELRLLSEPHPRSREALAVQARQMAESRRPGSRYQQIQLEQQREFFLNILGR